jgi:hypothetical protein
VDEGRRRLATVTATRKIIGAGPQTKTEGISGQGSVVFQLKPFPVPVKRIGFHSDSGDWVVGLVLPNSTITFLATVILFSPLVCDEAKKGDAPVSKVVTRRTSKQGRQWLAKNHR